MVFNGILLRKVRVIEQVVAELQSLVPLSVEQLQTDWKIRRAVERNFQIAIEAMIDICQRILSVKGQTPASTAAEAIKRCVQLEGLSNEHPYRHMVQFRNFMVHQYGEVSPNLLIDLVNQQVGDFHQFVRKVQAYVTG
ncbi:MAG: DUF86 domain-containing protein [Rhodothermus sp.]|nr:DUF86 domain-containing protein [Rhodothermus sp.]